MADPPQLYVPALSFVLPLPSFFCTRVIIVDAPGRAIGVQFHCQRLQKVSLTTFKGCAWLRSSIYTAVVFVREFGIFCWAVLVHKRLWPFVLRTARWLFGWPGSGSRTECAIHVVRCSFTFWRVPAKTQPLGYRCVALNAVRPNKCFRTSFVNIVHTLSFAREECPIC